MTTTAETAQTEPKKTIERTCNRVVLRYPARFKAGDRLTEGMAAELNFSLVEKISHQMRKSVDSVKEQYGENAIPDSVLEQLEDEAAKKLAAYEPGQVQSRTRAAPEWPYQREALVSVIRNSKVFLNVAKMAVATKTPCGKPAKPAASAAKAITAMAQAVKTGTPSSTTDLTATCAQAIRAMCTDPEDPRIARANTAVLAEIDSALAAGIAAYRAAAAAAAEITAESTDSDDLFDF